jgi:ribosomal protein S14
MKANTLKNKKIRGLFNKFESIKKIEKFLNINLLCSNFIQKKPLKYFFLNTTFDIASLVSKSAIKNKCVISGRNNSVEKKFSLSRIEIRRLIHLGVIPGYKKAVW